jgi:2-methylcitrate dehydratase
MLLPADYADAAIADPAIAALIARMEIVHGGPDYDSRYPEGIPTRVEIDHAALGRLDGGFVLFPQGHARSDAARTAALVDLKFDRLVAGAVDDPAALRERMRLAGRTAAEIANLYAFPIRGCTSQ